MEGVGRGYGEVRGRLGDYCTVNYTSPKNWNNNNNNNGGGSIGNGTNNVMMNGYKICQRSHSLPVGSGTTKGSVCGETEISFASATSGGGGGGGRRSPLFMMNNTNNGNMNNINDSDTGRSLSPLQWVNGSEIKGVMKWFA